MHVQRIDSNDNPADAYAKPLPAGSFWRHSTAALGDRFQTHKNVELRDRILATEYHGGSVKAVVRDLVKTKSGKQKAAEGSQKDSRNERQTDKGRAIISYGSIVHQTAQRRFSRSRSTIDDVIQGSN